MVPLVLLESMNNPKPISAEQQQVAKIIALTGSKHPPHWLYVFVYEAVMYGNSVRMMAASSSRVVT